jgi:predicted transcriptional regulator
MPSRTISLRLDPELLKRLDDAARRRRRSRSFVLTEAIARHLELVSAETTDGTAHANPPRYARLMAMLGAGAPYSSFKTSEEIDAHIRGLRDDD